jgi:hypothetical protein
MKCILVSYAATAGTAIAQETEAPATQPVTPMTFARAETDTYFANYVKKGGFGKFLHIRNLTPIDEQDIVKMNRDTLYSGGVFDLTSPLTITKPDTGGRFQSMLVINQDHYVKMIEHGSGAFVLNKENIGTRYAMVVFRTLVDADDPADLKAAHAAQDGLTFSQDAPGTFEVPEWDKEDLDGIRAGLIELGKFTPTTEGRFGDVDDTEPINHLLGAAIGWGGNPPAAAVYKPGFPEENDGAAPHVVTVKDVPVDGFWSISIYNAEGFFVENEHKAYVINDRNARRNADGSITIHFGGDPKQANYLPIMEGWQYLVRLYQPRQEVIDGSWTFPIPIPVK